MTETRYKKESAILYIHDGLFQDIYQQMEESNRFKLPCERYAYNHDTNKLHDKIDFCAHWYGDATHYYFLLTNDERRRVRAILRTKLLAITKFN